jgi:hypothetical protein
MARKATFTPTGARAVGPGMRTSGGETFAQAQARQAGGKRGRHFFPNEDVSPERSFDSATLAQMAASQVFDSYADGTTRTTPFELDLDRQGMNDYIEFGDAYDGTIFQPKTTPQGSTRNPSQAIAGTNDAAPMSIIPTSTSDPKRPRTLMAGFEITDPANNTGTLSVMFRDGTMYNYYDVTMEDWRTFKYSPSKGKVVIPMLEQKYAHGYANQPAQAAGAIHKAAMVAQKTLHAQPKRKGLRATQVPRQTRRRKY